MCKKSNQLKINLIAIICFSDSPKNTKEKNKLLCDFICAAKIFVSFYAFIHHLLDNFCRNGTTFAIIHYTTTTYEKTRQKTRQRLRNFDSQLTTILIHSCGTEKLQFFSVNFFLASLKRLQCDSRHTHLQTMTMHLTNLRLNERQQHKSKTRKIFSQMRMNKIEDLKVKSN